MSARASIVLRRHTLRWSIPLAGALLYASGCAFGATAPIVDSQLVTYQVEGETIDEIQRSIAAHAPSRDGDSYYAGVTMWSLSATYDLIPTQQGCLLDNGDVYLTLRVHLPIMGKEPDSQAVNSEWRRFYTALVQHEALHQQNAYRAAMTLLGKINGTRTDVPCSRAKVIAESATQKLIERISAYDKDLDLQTGHGAAQGAYLNPNVR